MSIVAWRVWIFSLKLWKFFGNGHNQTLRLKYFVFSPNQVALLYDKADSLLLNYSVEFLVLWKTIMFSIVFRFARAKIILQWFFHSIDFDNHNSALAHIQACVSVYRIQTAELQDKSHYLQFCIRCIKYMCEQERESVAH